MEDCDELGRGWKGEQVKLAPFSIHAVRNYEEKPHNAEIYRNLEQDATDPVQFHTRLKQST